VATLKRWTTSTDRKKKSSLISESLQTLIRGSLGKKKGDKMKRALADLTSIDSDQQTAAAVAGNSINRPVEKSS